jgi:hypothetical protein
MTGLCVTGLGLRPAWVTPAAATLLARGRPPSRRAILADLCRILEAHERSRTTRTVHAIDGQHVEVLDDPVLGRIVDGERRVS